MGKLLFAVKWGGLGVLTGKLLEPTFGTPLRRYFRWGTARRGTERGLLVTVGREDYHPMFLSLHERRP